MVADVAAAECALVVARAAAVIAAVAAALGARRRCRVHPLAHRRSIDRPGVQARGPVMVIYQHQGAGLALAPEIARAAGWLEIAQAALAPVRVIGQA